MGAACQASEAAMEMKTEEKSVAPMRDALHQSFVSQLTDIHLNGHPESRLLGNLNLSFAGVQSHSLTDLDLSVLPCQQVRHVIPNRSPHHMS